MAELLGRRFGILLGTGTAALALACAMTNPARKRIVLPAIACVNVLYAVLYAGCEPVFADVRPEDGLVDPEHVSHLLASDPEIGAVVVVHVYGHGADMQRIRDEARVRGVLVIEDAAQAHGGTHADGSCFGASGDLGLVSFGHTKILDAGGGGVLTMDDRELYERCMAEAARLPPRPEGLHAQAQAYRAQYYSLWAQRASDPMSTLRIGDLAWAFERVFVHAADEAIAEAIFDKLPSLGAEIALRRELAAEYRSILSPIASIRPCALSAGSVPWRFVFRVPAQHRDSLVGYLRRSGHDASTWYPSLANFYPRGGGAGTKLPVAAAFEQEVVNLWVGPNYDRDHVRVVADSATRYFTQSRESA